MSLVLPLGSIASAYRETVVDNGNQPLLLMLVAFGLTFGLTRFITHSIRAERFSWLGDVEAGDTHIHHLVWGIILLLVSGLLAIVVQPPLEVTAIVFGIGAALTLDEFALWLELRDVYWEEEGRKSIDAVIVAGILAGFGVLGLSVWIDAADDVDHVIHASVGFWGLLGLILAAVTFLKEKFVMGVTGFFIWPVALVGAARLGRPHSPWSRWFYDDEKRERAHERFGDGVRPSLPRRGHHGDGDPEPAQPPPGDG